MNHKAKRYAKIERIVNEIVDRIERRVPINQGVIDQLPKGVLVKIPARGRTGDGKFFTGVFLIRDGEVTFQESVH